MVFIGGESDNIYYMQQANSSSTYFVRLLIAFLTRYNIVSLRFWFVCSSGIVCLEREIKEKSDILAINTKYLMPTWYLISSVWALMMSTYNTRALEKFLHKSDVSLIPTYSMI